MSSEPIFFSCVPVVNCRDVYQGSDVWEISLLRWMHNSALYPAVDLRFPLVLVGSTCGSIPGENNFLNTNLCHYVFEVTNHLMYNPQLIY